MAPSSKTSTGTSSTGSDPVPVPSVKQLKRSSTMKMFPGTSNVKRNLLEQLNDEAARHGMDNDDDEEPDVNDFIHITPSKRKMSKSQEMLEYFMENQIYSFAALNERPEEEWMKFASMPQFNTLAANYYTLVKTQFRSYSVVKDVSENSHKYNNVGFKKIETILKAQGYSAKRIHFLAYCLLSVSDQLTGKRNSILFHGKPSAGKSAIAESFVRSFFGPSFGCPDNSLRSQFKFNDCVNVRAILWEEPAINVDVIEDVKKIMGGQHHVVNAKYKSGVEILPTPVFLTSNKNLYQLFYPDPQAIKVRTFTFDFPNVLDDTVDFNIDWPITKEDWYSFFNDYKAVFPMVINKKFTYEEES